MVKILDQKARDAAVVIALGSNMAGEFGSPDAVLERAILTLGDHLTLGKKDITVTGRSRLWRSRAWPDPMGPEYRNAVVLVETPLTPAPLLSALHTLERAFGRTRTAANAPRTLDLDIVAYGRRVEAGPPCLPHPRAAERRFVMGPLAELLPDWTHPVSGERADVLAKNAPVGGDAEPLAQGPVAEVPVVTTGPDRRPARPDGRRPGDP